MSENICRLGDRMSSEVRDSLAVISKDGIVVASSFSRKTASNSVRNMESTGVGILRVGENTMPTLRMVILLTSELLMIFMRKAERARRSVKLGLGSLWTRTLYAAIFLGFSVRSEHEGQYFAISAHALWQKEFLPRTAMNSRCISRVKTG